jgi:hypothetical protein
MRAYAIRHVFQGDDSSGVLIGAETAGNGTPLNVAGLSRLGIQVSYTAYSSASLSPSSSASISPSGSASPSASASISPSASASISPSASASPSASVSPSSSPSAAPALTAGVVLFEATLNGTEWYPLPCTPIAGGSAATFTSSTPGMWIATVSGLSLVRARIQGNVQGAVSVIGLGTAAAS